MADANHSRTPRSSSPPGHSSSYLDNTINLETYRTLLDLPTPRTERRPPSPDAGAPTSQDDNDNDNDNDVLASSSHAPRLPRWWPTSLTPTSNAYTPLLRSDPEHASAPQGVYPTLLHQQSLTQKTLHQHTTLKTSILLSQLFVSILLILLASVPSLHGSTAIAIFAALNGIGAGVLALVSGKEGARARLGAYKEGLRGLRARIEWVEREVACRLRVVTYREVLRFKDEFEELREGFEGVV